MGRNHEMYRGEGDGSFLNGNHFIVHFEYDVMPKHTGKRMTMDKIDLLMVEYGKIIKDEFFSGMG